MKIRKMDSSGIVTNSKNPLFIGARLILGDGDDSDYDHLIIYDSKIGPEYGQEIAYLDKTNPNIMLLDDYPCDKGLYAFLPRHGECIVYYKN